MAVVTKYGSAARDPAVKPPLLIPAGIRNGKLRTLFSSVPIANGDSTNSVLHFGAVPSTARLAPNGLLLTTAITSLTDFDLGMAGAIDKLVDGQSLASASRTLSAVSAVAIADFAKPLWQVLGLAADPGGDIDIIGTLKADAGANGTLGLWLPYSVE